MIRKSIQSCLAVFLLLFFFGCENPSGSENPSGTTTNPEITGFSFIPTANLQEGETNALAGAVAGTLGSVQGGTGPFSYALVSGQGDIHNDYFVVDNASLRIGGTALPTGPWAASTDTALTPGTALTAGNYSVRVRVSDTKGKTFAKAITIIVTAPGSGSADSEITGFGFTPTVNLREGENVFAGVSVGTLGLVWGGTGPYTYALVSGSGDANNNRFFIYYDYLYIFNTALTAGTYSVRVQVRDSKGKTFAKSITITVAVPESSEAPTIISEDNITVLSGTGGMHQVWAIGTSPISYSLSGTVPNGVTINAATGLITIEAWTTVGEYYFTLMVANSAGSNAVGFVLTVNAVPVAPTISSANNKTVTYGTGGTHQVIADGTSPISYSLSGAPTGVTIGTGTGFITIAGTSAVGLHSFTITASNGTSPDATQTFSLTVDKLTLTALATAANRVYNGSDEIDVTITPTNMVGTDTVTLMATGTVHDANVGDYKTVTIGSISLSGTDSGNYNAPMGVLNDPTVTITKAPIFPSVSIASLVAPAAPSPSYTGTNPGDGAVSYTYSTAENGWYSSTVPTSEGTYWVKATVSETSNYQGGTSAAVSFTISSNAQAPHINNQLQNATYARGITATALSVSAYSQDGGTLSYEWYRNATNSTAGGTLVGTNASYTPSTAEEGTLYYYVIVTNNKNGGSSATNASATSNVAAITVTVRGTISLIFPEKAGDALPEDAIVISQTGNGSHTLTVSGTYFGYQWRVDNKDTGNSTNTLPLLAASYTLGTHRVTVVVTSASGHAYSKTITFKVEE
ncbi:beta strand repeat-containing protein [Leadbettera azotonutricia]|uniref:Putative Ig family protein n=1 Tax=Leadbettera azotonutricia (strain ATCC BAA-888 / DSM 13862 / ZAS-9) TaxID=545695 RepID=F5YG75_LEAAZ|nr:YDG domain-containing protein [Leadbettera azotonutricia]AEF82483.1 putative Ig family protein [Leadbettera azotonutricia ZAS-9]